MRTPHRPRPSRGPRYGPTQARAQRRRVVSADKGVIQNGDPASKTLGSSRREPSADQAVDPGLAQDSEQSGDLLDYGCGTGADVKYYLNQGLDAEGYDPHPPFGYADLPRRQFRAVTLIFVLNVLPTAPERREVLRRAASFLASAGLLVVATRSTSAIRAAAHKGGWRAWNDETSSRTNADRRSSTAWTTRRSEDSGPLWDCVQPRHYRGSPERPWWRSPTTHIDRVRPLEETLPSAPAQSRVAGACRLPLRVGA